ncbi:hypothetical protein [Streptomyces sp. AcH 505]|uniref:hypothetical protein n=1 Tax=Streptomyces sp. AcH 505 TaxID=352211 RepID=UPI000A45B7C6
MTYPQNVRTAPPSARPPAPAQPPRPPAPPGVPPARRSAWSETRERLGSAATTEPGRLRIIGAALALLVLVFGAVTAWQASDRYASADDVVNRSQPVKDAANIYRSLAAADTDAATGFLAGATEPPDVQAAYRKDIATASELLVRVAKSTEANSGAARLIADINSQLPVYTGLIERARAANRQDQPLGGAYLRYANEQMTKDHGLLPNAEALYNAETKRLQEDSDQARIWPFAALGLGVLTLAVLVWAQRRNYRSTNRVFNQGLLGATAATTAVLLWLIAGQALSSSHLGDANTHGQSSLAVLNEARINALKARANENLTLVSRGSILAADGINDKYEVDFNARMKDLESELGRAKGLADDAKGRDPVTSAITSISVWEKRNDEADAANKSGDFERALKKINGAGDTAEESFNQVESALNKAIGQEQSEFDASADAGRGALTWLAAGAGVLAVLGALGALLGVGRRLSEYR